MKSVRRYIVREQEEQDSASDPLSGLDEVSMCDAGEPAIFGGPRNTFDPQSPLCDFTCFGGSYPQPRRSTVPEGAQKISSTINRVNARVD